MKFNIKKAGDVNFLFSQSSYQHTVDINFKTPWWKKPGKMIEANMVQVTVFSFFLLISREIIFHAGKSLLSYLSK